MSLLCNNVNTVCIWAYTHMGQILINNHTHEPQHEYISLNGMIGQKTRLFFHSPEENKLPWGFAEGKITNPVKAM